MGFFTWRQTKKTKQQVRALRRDTAKQAKDAAVRDGKQAQETREIELFQALPAEGKAEFRASVDELKALEARRHSLKELQLAIRKLAEDKEAVFRKYDLIP